MEAHRAGKCTEVYVYANRERATRCEKKGKKHKKTVISVRPFIRTSDPPAPVVSDQKGKRGQGGGRRRREKNIEIWWEQMEKRDREEGSDMRTDSEMGMEMERGEERRGRERRDEKGKEKRREGKREKTRG